MQLVIDFAINQPTKVSKHAGISDEACLNCHGNGNPRWFQISSTAGHKVHFEEQEISCVKCHSTSIHRFSPPTEICKVCHTEEKVKITAMGERYCLDCHQFLTENSPLRPTRQTCLDCHLKQAQTRVHWPENAPMRFQCSQCHKPHVSESPVVSCLSCHQDVPKEGLHKATTHASSTCQTCHKPHEWEVQSRWACITCHANKIEHNLGILCSNCHNFRK
ncbi:MAG: cytochrome c3 family protein [Dehalococcoidia bacterium]|nr:cytochrome c3 family protein [Dehalococcoidia bacterium]